MKSENLQFSVIGIAEEEMLICSTTLNYIQGGLPTNIEMVRAFIKHFDFTPDYLLVVEVCSETLEDGSFKLSPCVKRRLAIHAFDDENQIHDIR